MTKNIGNTDRMIRFTLGVILLAAGAALQITTGKFWWLALISAVPFTLYLKPAQSVPVVIRNEFPLSHNI